MHAYIKARFAHVKHDFANLKVSFAVSLTLQVSISSGGSYHIKQHGSMQLSRPEHQLDGRDAAHWWSIPSGDRISLDLAPGGQSSTDSGDVGAHRLCPTHQSAQDHCSDRYHLSLFLLGSWNVHRSFTPTSTLSHWSSLSTTTLTNSTSSSSASLSKFCHLSILDSSTGGLGLGGNPQLQFHRLGQLTDFVISQFYIRRLVVWDSVAICNPNFLSVVRRKVSPSMGMVEWLLIKLVVDRRRSCPLSRRSDIVMRSTAPSSRWRSWVTNFSQFWTTTSSI